jgi:hypothetical protein
MEKRKFLTLPGLELRPLDRPDRSQSLYRLRYPGSYSRCRLFSNQNEPKSNVTPRRSQGINIKMDLKGTRHDGAAWSRLIQGRIQWRAFVTRVMDRRFPPLYFPASVGCMSSLSYTYIVYIGGHKARPAGHAPLINAGFEKFYTLMSITTWNPRRACHYKNEVTVLTVLAYSGHDKEGWRACCGSMT